jgi:hypothetical protein
MNVEQLDGVLRRADRRTGDVMPSESASASPRSDSRFQRIGPRLAIFVMVTFDGRLLCR